MKIGYIGLGKMGKNMVMNMIDHKHEIIAWNRSPAPLQEIAAYGATPANSVSDLVDQLPGRRVIWVMLTAGDATEDLLFGSHNLLGLLQADDILIDGGNSNFNDSKRRFEKCAEKGVHFLDVGTSGGPAGARNGACLMIGGEREVYEYLKPLFGSISTDNGYKYVGPAGAGHYVKMVHNAVEYGFMQSMGEGFEMIKRGPYTNLDMVSVANIWNNGSVIESKLMRLAEQAFAEDATLDTIQDYVEDNGEAQWTIETALQYKIPVTTLAHALFMRYASRHSESFALKVVAILRKQFGGHAVKGK